MIAARWKNSEFRHQFSPQEQKYLPPTRYQHAINTLLLYFFK